MTDKDPSSVALSRRMQEAAELRDAELEGAPVLSAVRLASLRAAAARQFPAAEATRPPLGRLFAACALLLILLLGHLPHDRWLPGAASLAFGPSPSDTSTIALTSEPRKRPPVLATAEQLRGAMLSNNTVQLQLAPAPSAPLLAAPAQPQVSISNDDAMHLELATVPPPAALVVVANEGDGPENGL